MKVESTSIVVFGEQNKLRFSELVSFTSPSSIAVEITNHDKDDDTLVVKMTFETDNLETAKFQTEKELVRLVNLLSWKHNIVIAKYRTTSFQHSETKGQTHAIVLAETLYITESLSMLKTVGSEGVQKLSLSLGKTCSEDAENILLKWRDAIGQESQVTRLLLLFQILEELHGSRKGADLWIRATDQNISLRMTGKNGDEEVSIYTYLRDCIHAKPENPQFPFNEFEQNVNNLQTLVRQCLEGRFPELIETP